MFFLKLFKLIFRVVIGEIDEEVDVNLDLSSIRVDLFNVVVY